MTFARPWLLLLLLLLPLWWLLRRRRAVPAARYSDVTLPAMATRRRWWVVLPPVLRGLALAGLCLAAAGPRIGGDTVEIKQEGIAIVITIDISSSMLAEDFAPSNRLEVAKRQAESQQRVAETNAANQWRIERAEILAKNLQVLASQGPGSVEQRYGVLLSLARGDILDPELAVSYALELGKDNASYMRAVLEATAEKNYGQLAQAFKMTCLQRFGVEKAAEICKDDALADRSDAIAQVFQDELEAVTAAGQPAANGPLSILKDEREVQAFPGKMAWLFEPYLQDLYERRQWQEIDRFEKFSVGSRAVASLVLATARTGELVSASESTELDRFHAERRKWLAGYLLGHSCDPDCRGKLVDVMLSSYGEAEGDYDEPLKRLVRAT